MPSGARAVPHHEGLDPAPRSGLRADAARNVAQIRAAAVAAFHGRGLSTPLEQIATAAGVSKATIYNHFGGREGLIDVVIGELVATAMFSIMDRSRRVDDPWDAVVTYVNERRTLQYDEPAFTDALLMTYPKSANLVALAEAATRTTEELLDRATHAGVLRPNFTAADLYYADVANGLALRALPTPSREEYDHRTRMFVDSLRPRMHPR